MALKKIKPLSPDIYLGHTIGDNTVARLGHVNDIISKFRKVYEFEVPGNGDTVRIIPNHVETIVTFIGDLTDDFTLDVVIDPIGSQNLGAGDRMYIFLSTGSNPPTITFSGEILYVGCGSNQTTLQPDANTKLCLEVIYSGEQFIGIDNC